MMSRQGGASAFSDLPSTVWNRKRVIIGDLSVANPVGDLVIMLIFDVAGQTLTRVIHRGTATLLTAPVQVLFPRACAGEPLKDKEAG